MKYDDLVEELGEFGPYQRRVYVLSCLPAIAAAIQTLIPVFILAVPDYRCAVPGLENDTYSTRSEHHQALINHTLPWTDFDPDDDTNRWGSALCHVMVNRSALDPDASLGNVHPTNHTRSCGKWVYDTSTFTSTFVTQDNLVCDDTVLRSHANMIYMAGLLVSSIVFGIISDMKGRKTAVILALTLHLVSSVCLIFSPNFAVFAAIRFITGFSNMGIFMCSFVLAMELVGRKWRSVAGVAIQFFWCLGMFILDGMAYGLRDWKHLQLASSCYVVLLLGLWWLIPESPRWLINKGRIEEARVILEKVAQANNKVLPKAAFEDSTSTQPKGKLTDVFKYPVLAFRATVVFINWLVVTMVYYGLTLNVGSLGGNIYMNFALNAGVETLGNVVTMLLLPRWGRKKFHCFSMFLSGVACLCSMIPAILGSDVGPWVNILVSNVGKFGATCGFSTIYIFSAELFPTSLRNSVVGSSSMVARVGGMVAPYIADLGILVGGHFGSALPFIVFGVSGLIAGLLALTLPETLNMTLPETIQDAIDFGNPRRKGEDDTEKTNLNNHGSFAKTYLKNEGHVNKAYEPDNR